jgi:hypothetical protein
MFVCLILAASFYSAVPPYNAIIYIPFQIAAYTQLIS